MFVFDHSCAPDLGIQKSEKRVRFLNIFFYFYYNYFYNSHNYYYYYYTFCFSVLSFLFFLESDWGFRKQQFLFQLFKSPPFLRVKKAANRLWKAEILRFPIFL
jgi:hypothetical protein